MYKLTPKDWSELQKQYDPKTLEGMIQRKGNDIYSNGQSPSDNMGIPTSEQQYKIYQDSQSKYQKQQTGGASFLAALKSALAGADTQNTALRNQEKALTEQQYSTPTKYREDLIGQGITDPYKRQALLDAKLGGLASNLTGVQGKLSDLGGQRADVLNTAGKAYDAETAASLQQVNSAGDFFRSLLSGEQANQARLAQEKFDSRMDPLTILQKQAEIDATNRSNRGGSSGSSGTKNRILTILEAQKFNVPVGTTLYDVIGQEVPSGNTASYEKFLKDASFPDNQSVDTRKVYQDYLEAQQIINQDPTQFDKIINDPTAAPFSYLLKPKSQNDLISLLSGLLGGQSVDTTQ
jgi:hypothetical protein